MNETYLYPYSVQEAIRNNELPLWRESHRANLACKQAIESAIRTGFDGMRLNPDCLKSVLEEYGYKRVGWVLSNTVRQKDYDGRFSHSNKAWAEQTYISSDSHNLDFVVESHPAVLDGFVDLYRKTEQGLNLFGKEHCTGDRAEQDFTGKVLVLSPRILKESYWSRENQLWYAHNGFGCAPHARGRSVRCTCLWDGEMTRWNRADFIGVLDEQYLPAWAQEKLAELTAPQQDQPEQSSMTMK